MELERIQSLLYRLITAPSGVAEGLAAEGLRGADELSALISGDERLTAFERLGIYADAYFYRLLEVLKEDYPATLAILGDAQFHNLITGYLLEDPPTEPSIMYAGSKLPAFLRGHPLAEQRPFLADLATLERALIEIFHAADAIALDAATMKAIALAEWPAITIRRHPASRILELDWHVEGVLRAVERAEDWSVPACAPVNLLVWRRNAQVSYRELEPGERDALMLAERGASFATICGAVAQETGDPAPAVRISRLLNGWIAQGLLLRDETGAAV
ncbi:MAG TPA: DNA-binding domain-containing protein [Candidatus Binataceae bacterium]|nr:DNA-binding domain-containing protein [Candidatus Binataceae bacterium]